MVLQTHTDPGGLLPGPPCRDLTGAPGRPSPGTHIHPDGRINCSVLTQEANPSPSFQSIRELQSLSHNLLFLTSTYSLLFKLATWSDSAGPHDVKDRKVGVTERSFRSKSVSKQLSKKQRCSLSARTLVPKHTVCVDTRVTITRVSLLMNSCS